MLSSFLVSLLLRDIRFSTWIISVGRTDENMVDSRFCKIGGSTKLPRRNFDRRPFSVFYRNPSVSDRVLVEVSLKVFPILFLVVLWWFLGVVFEKVLKGVSVSVINKISICA